MIVKASKIFFFIFTSPQLSVQFSCSIVSDSLWPHEPTAHQASLSITSSWSLPKPMSIELVMPSNHLILCHPFSSCPQSFPGSGSFQMSQLFASGGQSIGVILNSLSVGTAILTRRHSEKRTKWFYVLLFLDLIQWKKLGKKLLTCLVPPNEKAGPRQLHVDLGRLRPGAHLTAHVG